MMEGRHEGTKAPRHDAVRRGGALLGLMLLFMAVPTGCRQPPPPENLPAYTWVDDATAIKTLAERSRAVRSMSAEVSLTLTKPDGQSVQFDGAMATRTPDALRLQAFKFGRTVFDLTLNTNGMFVKTMDDEARKDKIIPASRSAARFAKEWSFFTGGLFEQKGLDVLIHSGPNMVVCRVMEDGRVLTCEVERATLTPRRYLMSDSSGTGRFTLDLSAYQLIGGIAHPTRLLAQSAQGTIDIELRNLELNVDHTDRAFVPPAGAEKLSEDAPSAATQRSS